MNKTIEDGMQVYRRRMRLQNKYSKLLEFDPIKRSNYRIVNFVKRHFLIKPVNISEEDYHLIPPIYRFRCYLFKTDELDIIEQMFTMQMQDIINFENIEPDVIEIQLESLKMEYQKCTCDAKQRAAKIPVMIDLRIYGDEPNSPISIGSEFFVLDEPTKEKIRSSYKKIIGCEMDKIQRIINWSKALSDAYKS